MVFYGFHKILQKRFIPDIYFYVSHVCIICIIYISYLCIICIISMYHMYHIYVSVYPIYASVYYIYVSSYHIYVSLYRIYVSYLCIISMYHTYVSYLCILYLCISFKLIIPPRGQKPDENQPAKPEFWLKKNRFKSAGTIAKRCVSTRAFWIRIQI